MINQVNKDEDEDDDAAAATATTTTAAADFGVSDLTQVLRHAKHTSPTPSLSRGSMSHTCCQPLAGGLQCTGLLAEGLGRR